MAQIISDQYNIKTIVNQFLIAKKNSHKGQNGRLLIIGGSSLFHSASLWSAEIASHFVDLVHYCSTKENQQVFINLKSKFSNGIIIKKQDLLSYVEEDDCILIGPGMIRGPFPKKIKPKSFKQILSLKDESLYSFYLTKYLLTHYPDKKFVIDAGALQMLDIYDLKNLKQKPILTPQSAEYKRLFNLDLSLKSNQETEKSVILTAKNNNSVLLVKKIIDYVTDGYNLIKIVGGNAGLTKGGSGDILAGLIASFYCKNPPLISAVLASYVLKSSAEELAFSKGIFYNISDIVNIIPQQWHKIIVDNQTG